MTNTEKNKNSAFSNRFLITLLLTILLLLMVLIGELIGISLSRKIMYTSCQPPEIDYGSYDPYCLHVITLVQPLSSQNIILISPKANTDYGNVINFPSPNIISKEEFENLKVQWKVDGLEVETIWNVKLSIPKDNFTRGR